MTSYQSSYDRNQCMLRLESHFLGMHFENKIIFMYSQHFKKVFQLKVFQFKILNF